jgi:pyrroloquinoline quinone (PQQ) biosynthesis protein C
MIQQAHRLPESGSGNMEIYPLNMEKMKEQLVSRICDHSFLTRCRSGTVSIDELKIFLVQQGLYSEYFTRYLCAMMANLPNKRHVRDLASNLCEELGLTVESAVPHSAMYREMLGHFDLTLEDARPLLGTRRLIDVMFDHCRDPRVARGLGALCLGGEALVSAMYADIIAGFEACDIPRNVLEFFYVHVNCDDGHAETMWDIMTELTSSNACEAMFMLSAGHALVDARAEFFSSIEHAHHADLKFAEALHAQ